MTVRCRRLVALVATVALFALPSACARSRSGGGDASVLVAASMTDLDFVFGSGIGLLALAEDGIERARQTP